MIALHPPFRAENMEALYNKVIKGQYGKISDIYSNDLSEIIKLLLKTNASERPSCGQILKHPFVKKRIEFFQVNSENEDIDNMDESALLLTIRIPKNILFLTDKLPTANYGNNKKNDGIKETMNKQKNTFPNTNLPDIKIKNKEKKSSSNNYLNEGDLLKEKEKERLKQLSNLNKDKNILNNNKENDIKNRPVNSHSLENNHIYHNNLIKKANIIQLDKIELNNMNNKRYDLSKKIQRKKQYDFQSYLKSIGLGNLYKLYSPNLDYNIKNNIKTKNYNNISKQKKINNSNVDYGSPKIIPNRRLNPISKRIKL
jgi:NIMA (never in mitosis gene a)-related kinase